MSDQWETFCDVGYYHMWRLRLKTERGWNDGFHINTRAEAEGLCELLNKLEGELNDYRNLAFQSERKLEEAQQQLLVKRSNNRRLDARNKRLEHESEKLKEELESHAWTISPAMAQAKIDELVEQRDRLAEALDRLERTAGLAALQDDPARVQARQALAAVKGGKDD
jgi:chromosome segregation ATPase